MAYLVANRLAFGSYSNPRQVRRRPVVRLSGHYGLGQQTEAQSFCQAAGAAIPFPGVRQAWIQKCITAYQQQHPAAAAAPAPMAAPAAPIAMPTPVAPIITAVAPTAAINDPSVAGTPVPPGFSKTSIYVDSQGNQWMFDPSSGMWKNATAAATAAAIASEQAQAAQIAAATATSPQGGPAPILVTSPTLSPGLPAPSGAATPVSVSVSTSPGSMYSDVLNWLSESTLISPVPNWVIAGAAVFAAIKLSGKGHLL